MIEQNSKSQLNRNDAPLKDAKYRGKSANRRDLFDVPTTISDAFEDGHESGDNGDTETDGESVDENISEESEVSNDSSYDSEPSTVSADDKDINDEDQQTRRDKVRQLLAQETK